MLSGSRAVSVPIRRSHLDPIVGPEDGRDQLTGAGAHCGSKLEGEGI